ncbi:hypothetical protein F5Y04DRAFT_253656 [Hypomontagnella monticulosa]|nr:hypothetical protein F5Y04DRAFT_253656 [Hypomontagnella monticulosa]
MFERTYYDTSPTTRTISYNIHRYSSFRFITMPYLNPAEKATKLRMCAPLAQEYMRLYPDSGSTLGDILFSQLPHNLIWLFAVPVDGHEYTFSFHKEPSSSSGPRPIQSHGSPAKLLCLPFEIHTLILDQLQDNREKGQLQYRRDRDCMRLGLTNKYFLTLVLPYLHKRWVSRMGPWAGKNVVFVGWPGYDPPQLLSEDEALPLGREMAIHCEKGCPISPSLCSFFLHDHKGRTEIYLKQTDDCLACALHGVDFKNPSAILLKYWTDIMQFERMDFYPQGQQWILRNLTTKEFVRSEAIALDPTFIHGPDIDGIGFGHVILSRICWSTDPLGRIENPTNIMRGVWAGHRFDITHLSRHREITKGEKWADVSNEVVNEIARIWEGEFGPGWREHVIERRSEKPPEQWDYYFKYE